MLISVIFILVNLTEYVARQYSIVSCVSMDASLIFQIGGIIAYYFLTASIRNSKVYHDDSKV